MAATSLHFVTSHIQVPGLDAWARGYVEELRNHESETCRIADSPEEARFIVFIGTGIKHTGILAPNHLAAHPLRQRFPEKTAIWSTEDQPLPSLPGLYASLPRRAFSAKWHRTFTYWELPTRDIAPFESPRDLLYSFVGGPTSAVRRALHHATHPHDTLVLETPNYNHGNPSTEEVRRAYAEILARSRFTLCPRGVGASSYRLFESMRFGSVPVIIADDLVDPEVPGWRESTVRIAERDLDRVEEILRRIGDWETRGRRAQAMWREHFSHDHLLDSIARQLSAIDLRPAMGQSMLYWQEQSRHLAARVAGKIRKRG